MSMELIISRSDRDIANGVPHRELLDIPRSLSDQPKNSHVHGLRQADLSRHSLVVPTVLDREPLVAVGKMFLPISSRVYLSRRVIFAFHDDDVVQYAFQLHCSQRVTSNSPFFPYQSVKLHVFHPSKNSLPRAVYWIQLCLLEPT